MICLMKKPVPSKKAKKSVKRVEKTEAEPKEEAAAKPAEEQKPPEASEQTAQAIPNEQPTPQETTTASVQPEIKLNMETEQIGEEESQEKEKAPGGGPPAPADDKFAIFDEEEEKSKSSILKIILLFVLGFVVGGVSVGAVLYFVPFQKTEPKETSAEQETTTPAATIEEAEEATESAEAEEELDLSTYSLQILNGSGVAGAAGAVQKILEDSGFAVFDLGNADSYNYQETEIQVIGGLPKGVYDEIEKALTDYNVVLSEENLSEDSEHDVVIIVGQKK